MNRKRLSKSVLLSLATTFVGVLCVLWMAWGIPHDDTRQPRGAIVIEGIEVMEFQGHPVVRVASDGIQDYFTYEIRSPDGIVVQVPGASLGSLEGRRTVDVAPISEVRAVQKQGPTGPMAEILIILQKPVVYGVVSEYNQLFVHLEAQEGGDTTSATSVSKDVKVDDEPSAETLAKRTLCKSAGGDTGVSPQVNPFAAPSAGRLMDLLVHRQEDGTRVVLVGDGELSKFNTFTLENPKRVVLDVWDVKSGLGTDKIPVNSKELSKVRIGPKPDKVRLVFDVDEAMDVFPPYSVGKEKGKVFLCLGDLAKAGEAQLVEPSDRSLAEVSVKPTSSFMKKRDPSEESETERADTGPAFSENVASRPALVELPENTASSESPPGDEVTTDAPVASKAPEREGKGDDADVGREMSTSHAGPIQTEPQIRPEDKPYLTARASHEAVSLAQISASLKSEEEDAFKISTGMEPGKVYEGQRVNLDFQDIDIHNVFRLLAEVSNLNIIVSDKVTGKLTMRLRDVPWDQALDLVLSTQKLGTVKQGNIIRVAPLQDLVAEEAERRRMRQAKINERIEAQKKLEVAEIQRQKRERELMPFETVPILLNYTNAKAVEKQINGFLTKKPKRGTVVVDDRTNMITITDYPERIAFIKEYIERVDRPTPQVLIEARIVKASKEFDRELGIQWGGQYAETDVEGGTWAYGISGGLGGVRPSTWSSGDFTEGTGGDFFPLSTWAVNLPAALLGGSTPAIGFQVGRLIGDLVNLDLRLSAAELEGLSKTISRPKIMTLDNVEATIKQGFEIPYTQVNPEGQVSVVWKKAELKVTVTPLVSPDGRVHLKLEVTDDFPDPTILSSEGEPSIRTRQATTEVLVRNGETVVIGGILEETRASSERGVPWMRDVPLLGWLFETKFKRSDQTELLIFVTPFIVEEA